MDLNLMKARTEASKGFDEALYTYMRIATTPENARKLQSAGDALNQAVDACEAAEKEEAARFVDQLIVDLITAAGRVNSDAERKDAHRNRVNYGIATQCACMLHRLGVAVEVPRSMEGDYLTTPKVVINGKETVCHNR